MKDDLLDFLIDVEENGFDAENEDHVKWMQRIHDSGVVYQLQGRWGRLARDCLAAGIIKK